MKIGVLHPGEMGVGIAKSLRLGGNDVFWLPEGRSDETRARAESVELTALASLDEMVERCEVIVSICPPHAAVDVANKVAATRTAFSGFYVDANAIAPQTSSDIEAIVTERGTRYVDAGVIGFPPPNDRTRFYLSGPHASVLEKYFADAPLSIVTIDEPLTAASMLKMSYAAWTKISASLILGIRAMARSNGIEDYLVEEWNYFDPNLGNRADLAAYTALTKGWRWIGEMEEIAKTFSSNHLPDGFGLAAAEIYRRVPRQRGAKDQTDLQRVIEYLRNYKEWAG